VSDIPVRLRPRAVVPSGWPPDVSPNQTITAAHINAIRSSAYAWPGDVDGQGHTLSNVHLAGATGVLSDPTTTAGDILARDGSALGRFPIGAAGQVLTVDTAAPAKLRWATPAVAPVASVFGRLGAVVAQAGDYTAAMVTGAVVDSLTTKGDIFARGAAGTGRLPAGADGLVLRTNASQPFGLQWTAESVWSVFGRLGSIVAQAGDYTAAQITNAVSVLGSYPDPAWLTSLSWVKLIGVPATFPPAAHTHDAAAIVSGVLSTARLGTGVASASVYLRGDGTWAAAGTGGGGGVISVFGRAGTVVAQGGDYTAAMVTGAVVDPTVIKGDLMVRNDINVMARLPVGASGQVLQADTSLSVGMKWTTLGAAVQTPWVTNVDAAGYQLANVSRVGVAMVPGYPLDVTGDINYSGTLRKNGAPVSFGGSQTPWTSNIDAAGFLLNNAGAIGIGGMASSAKVNIVAGSLAATAGAGIIMQMAQALSANSDDFSTALWRASAGNTWDSAYWRVGRRVDASEVAAIEFGAATLAFRTNAAQRMIIDTNGNMGIGVAAPGSRLHIAAATTTGNISTAHQFHLGLDGNIQFGLQVGYFYTDAAGFASVLQNWQGAAGGNLLLQPSGGNVAIGHTGAAAINSLLHLNKSSSGAVGPILTLENSTGALHDAVSIRFLDATLRGELRMSVESSPYGGDLIYFGGSAGQTEIFRATSAGNFGINVQAPLAPLHVRTVSGGETLRLSCDSYGLGSGPVIGFYFVDTNYAAAIGTYGVGNNAADLVFSTANAAAPAERMRITADGRVGIGVTPNALNGFEVNLYQKWAAFCPNIGGIMPPNANGIYAGWNWSSGGAEAVIAFNGGPSGLVLADTTGSTWKERLRILANGNFGIAVSSPNYKLDVGGDVNCAGAFRVNGAPLSFAPTVHTHDASAIVSGVLASARLGAGTANSSVYLRGDGQWAAPAASGGGVTSQSGNLAGSSRVIGTTYTNSSGKPMFVVVSVTANQANGVNLFSGSGTPGPGTQIGQLVNGGTFSAVMTASFWVLPGNQYVAAIVNAASLTYWTEWT